MGEPPALGLSECLRSAGLKMGRLKTDTPPRVNARTVDWAATEEQPPDPDPRPFSFSTERIDTDQLSCYMTHTNAATHEIIRKSLDRSPLYDGQITAGMGPRYCPSIEIKVLRFPEKDSHLLFLEPEGRNTLEVYCNGLFTSLPMDVQEDMAHSIRGLEKAQIIRYGYAVEYDWAPPTQLGPGLETKRIRGLFHAGQINGTSGYEEAAAQGIMAGINAARKLQGKDPLILGRDEAYIGVLIDDLVTRGTEEPYRMFTSLAEYRLVLRQDNADRRLMKYGRENGLIPEALWQKLQRKEKAIRETTAYIHKTYHGGKNLAVMLRRPEMDFERLAELHPRLNELAPDGAVREQVQIETKYEGYLGRQMQQIQRFRRNEEKQIPDWIDYNQIPELRCEAREKLSDVQPVSLGQASRISGVSPADISVLMVYVEGRRKTGIRRQEAGAEGAKG